jgi:high-affinity nickel-transport protein
LAYLAVFGVGTVAGMMLITVAIAAPFAVGAKRLPLVSAGVRAAAGVLSLAFGLFLMYEVGVVGGLFSADPQWQPK